MLDYGGGALQAIVYLNNNVTLIKNVSLRKREGNIIFIANGGTKEKYLPCFQYGELLVYLLQRKHPELKQNKENSKIKQPCSKSRIDFWPSATSDRNPAFGRCLEAGDH